MIARNSVDTNRTQRLAVLLGVWLLGVAAVGRFTSAFVHPIVVQPPRHAFAFHPLNRHSERRILVSSPPKNDKPLLDTRLYSEPPPILIIVVEDDDDENDPMRRAEELEEEEEQEEEDEEEQEPDPYLAVASSEFLDDPQELNATESSSSSSSSIVPSLLSSSSSPTTRVDWGGALGRLRERVQDVESGDSQNPSKALFRLMSSQSPNQAIGSFITRANPQVIEAMSNAVGSLLGGLASPQSGVETIVKASGDKIGSLCFQLQMTGYMFRNAEYVMALKKIMDITPGSATLEDYKEAFDRLDRDGSGYIEASEVRDLLDDVYKGETPSFEINAFVKFFDKDQDGRVSWEEFKVGLGTALAQQGAQRSKLKKLLSPSPTETIGPVRTTNHVRRADDDDDEQEEEEDVLPEIETSIAGTIEIEMEDGKTVEVDAAEYLQSLKEEARLLKEELRKEKLGSRGGSGGGPLAQFLSNDRDDDDDDEAASLVGGISSYIASRQGDMKALTEGISPEIVETMKLLVDFVLEGGQSQKGRRQKPNTTVKREEMSMEIPAAALQQLALWQLILGYQLREAEAKGDYLKLLE
ncbi:hypothetical protein ACA910_005553 [Epithemia clementina (nom. ined.)]